MKDPGDTRAPADGGYDVAVVGFGPVGAFTALLLAESGLRVAVLERSSTPVVLPRAVGLDGESMRAFQRVGLGETVAAILQPPREPDEVCFTDSRRRRLFGLEIPPEGLNGWRDLAYFDQPELEALLRDLVGREKRIRVFLGHEVTAVEPTENEVVLRSRAGDGEATLRAAFAIGCDGASSFVRRALGIQWQSLGYDQDWLVVDIVQGPEAELRIDAPPTSALRIRTSAGSSGFARARRARRCCAPSGSRRCSAPGCRRATTRSAAPPSISSTPPRRHAGGWAASSWPATRPTRARPFWARA
jgi:2-polyprenyl-6-methoxyphenol hydroxylase-like FAD-dependent oxidoreductase